MKNTIVGLHHVTAIAGDPQRNLDFYVGTLGLRLVKRTVNFDDPGTYHFYFGDGSGSPGTILTFFPWPNARPGARGTGEVEATAFAIPTDSIGYWLQRLAAHGVETERAATRFGDEVIRFADPDGMTLELISSPPTPDVQPWNESRVPIEHSLRGFHSVTAALEGYERTARLLTETFGYQLIQEVGNRFRFQAAGEGGVGKIIDLLCMPDGRRAGSGAGSVHHIALRASDDEQQREWREQIADLGYSVSPVMDRTYFHSIYFREPGGVLFEIATDPPGFTFDESLEELGTNLRLPPQYERSRERIEQILQPIIIPQKEGTP
ncbi:glyoxalase family protein [Abditibacterium utsteinense]|uniref:Glyoxalase family protein n=1 Tax=Abditibacterium utsteinense TaxID=1960156 RepID=A0A2S8SPE1_9BACT|nr:ring-cleaving dioxygenase [Abditibacterium utsteinense]PQV62658.1 glyoxalase family protein [Abditibacterium utsteinense]